MKVNLKLKQVASITLCMAASLITFLTACEDNEQVEQGGQGTEISYPYYLAPTKTTDEYTETPLYVMNEETDRRIYSLEITPNNVEGKVPIVVYVHGGNGDVTSLVSVAEGLAEYGIAGITFECCGANRVNPKSDGKEIYSSHYTSRISDLESILSHVKTLDYVDTDQIYIYGQSYGGLVCMLDAPNLNDEVSGMFLESTGLTEDGSMVTTTGNGVIDKYLPPEDVNTYIKSFTKDILIFCSQGDSTGAHENGQYTASIYMERSEGKTKFYSFEGGEHSFNTFTQKAKQEVFAAMRSMIESKGIV